MVWALYAVALLATGFRRSVRWLRLAGLGLFGITAAKLVAVDLADVDPVYRALSFLVLGLLLTASSYLYHRFAAEPGGSRPSP
jgi:uncharacterized membrane protein